MATSQRGVLSPRALDCLYKDRKRKVNVDNWKDNKRKILKQSGKAYVSRNGTQNQAKQAPGPEIACNCKYKKCNDLNHDVILALFEKFYKMSHSEQTEYLVRESIELCEINRRTKAEDVSRRHCTFKYYIKDDERRKLNVCLKKLCNVYAITPRRVQMIQNKMKNNETLNDMRGMHLNRPHKIADKIKKFMHINSFPCQESHYSREKNAERKYLSADLNIQKMFQLFREKYPDQKMGNLHLYREIFHSDFNLKFGVPRSDTCAKCDAFYVQLINAATEEDLTKIQVESELHHRKVEAAYRALKDDTVCAKNDSKAEVLCVDLQQVLFCPTLTHNVFYQRQLSNYNFCISDVGTNEATMHLIIWSDPCVGQNNNFKILTLLQHLVQWGYFTQIEQKFLCSGHSFLPCDRNFALIEKKKKTSKALHPFQWVELIANVLSSQPFVVKVMEQTDFRDICSLEKQNKKPKEFKITEAMWLLINKDDPTSVHVRKSHNIMQPWFMYSIKKRKHLNQVSTPRELPLLYQSPIPIKKAKKENLIDMVKFIEDGEIQEFYKNLPFEDN